MIGECATNTILNFLVEVATDSTWLFTQQQQQPQAVMEHVKT